MAITETVTALPSPPHRGVDDRSTFVSKAEALFDALKNLTVDEINTIATQINATATTINSDATSAATSATTATEQAGVATTQAGIATTQAGIATAAVASIPAGSINDSITTLVDTWSSTKISTDLDLKADKDNPTFTGSITEQTAVATTVLEPDNGTIQYKTLTANTTFTDGLAEGQTLTLYVTNAGYTITYPTITWDNGAEPTLGTTDRLYFEKVNGVLYGFITGTF